MDTFDLRKYLAEGRLLKEDIKGMVDTDLALGGYLRMVEPNPEDYGVEQEEIDDIKKILSVPKMTWPDFMEVYNAFIAEHVDGSSDEILDIIDSHNLSDEEKEEVLSMYGGESFRIYKENISMEDGDDKVTYYAKELIKMHTPGDEKGVQGLLYYILDNPEEMPEDWDEDFVRKNFDEITDEADREGPDQEDWEDPDMDDDYYDMVSDVG